MSDERDTSRPVPIVENYAAIARQMRILEVENWMVEVKPTRCKHCKDHGWIWSARRQMWLVCGDCDNPHHKDKPYHSP